MTTKSKIFKLLNNLKLDFQLIYCLFCFGTYLTNTTDSSNQKDLRNLLKPKIKRAINFNAFQQQEVPYSTISSIILYKFILIVKKLIKLGEALISIRVSYRTWWSNEGKYDFY